jgi:ParB-like chromosome segregation protein Spo0J
MEIEIAHLALRYAGLRIMDPGRVSRLAASLCEDGQRTPVLVVQDEVLVDGYHRVAALRELGRDLVEAVTLELTEPDALIFAWRLETGRRRSAVEDGWLLHELLGRTARSAGDLARDMRRSKSWITERLGLVRVLPEGVQEAIRAAKIPPNGAMKSLVPMARADRESCERMVAALEGPVTVRQIERLYAAWRKADPEGRERIVAQPMLLLKAEEAVAPVSLDAEERLARDLEAIAGLCSRARRQAAEGACPRGNGLARRTWDQAREAFGLLQEEVLRARP